MPNIRVSVDRVKMLLQQNKLSLDEVSISVLKQAIYKTSSMTEMRGKGLENKMRMMEQFGMIREVRSGIWKVT